MSPSPHLAEVLYWQIFPKLLSRRDADRPDVSPGMVNHRSASNAQRGRPQTRIAGLFLFVDGPGLVMRAHEYPAPLSPK